MTAIRGKPFQFVSADGLRIACVRWEGRRPIRGVVQIAHGMSDHIGRYVGTVEALVAAGLEDISHDFYPGGRHEMLNETNRHEVLTRLLAWTSSVLEERTVAAHHGN